MKSSTLRMTATALTLMPMLTYVFYGSNAPKPMTVSAGFATL